MSQPTTSRAAVFETPENPLSIREFALPELRTGEALVRVECCTLCGSDLHSIHGRRSTPVPSILGHEIIGRIVDQSDEEPPVDTAGHALEVGARVVWSVAASCGECDRCVRGIPQKCRNLFKYGHESTECAAPLSGGLSEYCHIQRGTTIARVSEDVPATLLAPASCATATVAEAVRSVSTVKARRVLIFGAGMLGLTAAAMCSWRGAAEILVCDVDPKRLDRADQFGATSKIEWNNLADECQSANVVFEMSGAPSAVEASLGQLCVGGELVLVGSVSPTDAVPIDPERVVRNLLRIQGVHNYTPAALSDAVEFLGATAYPFCELVEREFSLDEVNQAISFASESGACRVAVVP
ncbi:MAG: alcohol dehydrogenase [Planctomycetaceae bacterium]|nr:alcohol dehydrogenase [Planctomycetaceae bacterium]